MAALSGFRRASGKAMKQFATPMAPNARNAREHDGPVTVGACAIGRFAAHILHAPAERPVLDSGRKCRSMILPILVDQGAAAAGCARAGPDHAAIVKQDFAVKGRAPRAAAERA